MLFLPTTAHGFEAAKWTMAWWNVFELLETGAPFSVIFEPQDGTDVHAW